MSNREIKFRGKYAKSHEWIYGDYFNNHDVGVNQNIIINHNEDTGSGKEHLVSPQYTGQFTGLCDKNGKEIYEDDIVHGTLNYPDASFNTTLQDEKGIVAMQDCCWMLTVPNGDDYDGGVISRYDSIEVIGNIHDNPELLKALAKK